MAYREYVGSRYVPIFGRKNEDSIVWDNSDSYEPLTVVLYQGNSYTSRQFVPAGIDISNEQFWALTGNYNAQVEQYRSEVRAFDGRITANADAIVENSDAISQEVEDRTNAIADEVENRINADTELGNRIDGLDDRVTENSNAIETINSDDWVTGNRIADNAINTANIINEAITADKIANEAVTLQSLAPDVIQAIEQPNSKLQNAIEAITTVQNNWLTSEYHTSYWGYKIPKELFEMNIANCNGSQTYTAPQQPVTYFMLNHPEAILGHNCDFGSSSGTRPTRVNGVNFNQAEEPHFYPLLGVDTNAQLMRIFPSYTNIATIPSNFDYAFSVSHQLITNGVANTTFANYSEQTYDWNTSIAPRIGVGEDNDYFYGLFCEGRGKCERGMTLPEFASLFNRIWHPDNAYNLDGGGSIYMCTNVPNMIMINRHKDFDKKFNEIRNNTLCMYYVAKED